MNGSALMNKNKLVGTALFRAVLIGCFLATTQILDAAEFMHALYEYSYLSLLEYERFSSCRQYLEGLSGSGKVNYALFAPQDPIVTYLEYLIGSEQRSIDIAMYHFTNGTIAEFLLQAHARGILVTIIVDRSCIADRYNKVEFLAAKGIKVLVYDPVVEWGKDTNGIMHNKCMILNRNVGSRPILVTGSFNYTSSAATKNYENVIISNDASLIKQYHDCFETLKKKSKPLKWWRENRPLLYYSREKQKTPTRLSSKKGKTAKRHMRKKRRYEKASLLQFLPSNARLSTFFIKSKNH